ncbi:hypothetical protein QR680_017701 [Steinernema hermaphroditum]|uniref:Uncharacterized protein n=1 Tax=Steinernema hermaphroditum TaxID=289476 RepID=A0AA39HGQ6_9BILA|nr:hypothetical protein QR680_017701 [Steinernema hermaphroditum]
MALIKRLEEKAKNCFDEKNYYEALQVYLTIYPRLKAQKKYEALIDFLYGGAMNMIKVGEFASALNLAELFIDTLTVSETKVSEELLDRFEAIFKRIPAILPNENETRIDRRSELLTSALKWTQAVAATKNEAKYGSPALHKRVADILCKNGNFLDAKKHYLLSNDPTNFSAGLIEFQTSEVCEGEADLVGTKAVLELLCYRKSAVAYQLLKLYAQNHPEITTSAPYKTVPLFSLCWLLILCLQTRRNTPKEVVLAYFSELVAFFKGHLDRDGSLLACLDKIGQVYLGLKPPGSEGGLLGSLLKGFMGAAKTEDKKEASLIDDTSADEFDADVDEAAFLNSAKAVGIAFPTLSQSLSRTSLSAPEEKKAKTDDPAPVPVVHSDMDLD